MRNKLNLLLTACTVATLGAGAIALSACGDTVKAHDHVWESNYVTTQRATCSEEGIRIRHCTFPGCNEVDSLPIPKLEHTWNPEPTTSATCTEAGYVIWTCKECGATQQGDPMKALGHDLMAGEVKEQATCIAKGKVEYQCSRCDYTELRDTNMLDHDYQLNEAESVAATCQAEGKTVYTCVNGCNQSETVVLEKVDHQLENENYVAPSFEADGHRKGTCSLCHQEIDEVIPQLIEGSEINFVFKIMRGSKVFTSSTMKIVVKNEKNEVVATGSSKNVIGGKFTVKLKIYPDAAYTCTLENLTGFGADPVTLTPYNSTGQINVTTKIYDENDPNAPKRYYQNSIVQDFTRTDVSGNEVHLADILKKNKLVVLNFFYTTCSGCTFEAEGLENAYRIYKDRGVALIGITCRAYDNETKIQNYINKYNCSFPIILDELDTSVGYMYYKYNVEAFPTSIFIDHEGVIQLIPQAGGYAQAAFEYWFDLYTQDDWEDLELDGGASVMPEVPQDENNGLFLAMIRGDYYLSDEND